MRGQEKLAKDALCGKNWICESPLKFQAFPDRIKFHGVSL